MKKFTKIKSKKGFTLLETLLATAILVIIGSMLMEGFITAMGYSGVAAENFPQQELVILSQLYSHVVRLLEEIENVYMRPNFPMDDVSLSLEGMEETFEEISGTLFSALESNRFKGFEIVKN